MKLLPSLILGAFLVMNVSAAEERTVPVWPDGAPGAKGADDLDKPSLTIYLPEASKATGAAIVICPGGAYRMLAIDHEGVQVARFLNRNGVAAFVLKYRLGPRYQHPAPLQDAQRALRYVRANAAELKVSPNRVGIMGFSAGGHLASTAATHFDAGDPNASDPVQKQSSRPDFAVLGYPVLSLVEPNVHAYSRQMLLGEKPDPKMVEFLSNEKQVTPNTPPAFLMHTAEDDAVPAENSILFYQALRKAGVPAELHIFAYGPHGIGLAPGDPAAGKWPELLIGWMRKSGFLTDKPRASVSGSVKIAGKPMNRGWVTLTPTGNNANAQPIASAFFTGGKFKMDSTNGPAIGQHKVEVVYLAEAKLEKPTLDDAQSLTAHPVRITEGANLLNLEFPRIANR